MTGSQELKKQSPHAETFQMFPYNIEALNEVVTRKMTPGAGMRKAEESVQDLDDYRAMKRGK
jgi:hypothetical protein